MSRLTRKLMRKGHKLTRAISFRVQNRTARVNEHPVIIFGNQKSGTTAIAALVAEAAGCSVTLDIPGIWGDRFLAMRAGTLTFSELVESDRVSFSRDIIKEPNLSFIMPQVFERLPQTVAAFVVRDPRQNIRSILDWLRVPGTVRRTDLASLTHVSSTHFSLLDGRRVGMPEIEPVAALAHRWCEAAAAYSAHRERLLLVRYEDFRDSKVKTIENVARELGLSPSCPFEHLVDHAFQPKGSPNVDLEHFFGPANLAIIDELCADRATTFGYC